MKITIPVWNIVNGSDCPLDIVLTQDDLERLAMEKARSQFEYNVKIIQSVGNIKVEL